MNVSVNLLMKERICYIVNVQGLIYFLKEREWMDH